MDIKLKSKIKNYLTGIWGIEVLVFLFLLPTIFLGYYQALNNEFVEIGAGTFDALLNKEKYIKGMIYYESQDISKYIYTNTNNLEDISEIKYDNEKFIGPSNYSDIFYILINKETGEYTTNDQDLFQDIPYGSETRELIEKETEKYIEEYGFISVRIDNEEKNNYYVKTTLDSLEEGKIEGSTDEFKKNNYSNIKNYVEIYYRAPSVYFYLIKTESITAKTLIAATILTAILFLKLVINLLFNRKNLHLEIRVFKNLFYVLKYGLKYKNTRNKILLSFGIAIGVILIYLYLVAGIRSENILVTFLTRYPFKGTLILILIPLITVLYSLKKSLDISIINDGLKKINSGDFEYTLDDIGEREVRELVDNINKIKTGYKIALNEQVKNEKIKTELISSVSHDLKTPLTSIINYVNILNNKNITEQERTDYLRILEKNSRRLQSLIEDLFEISKLNSGKMKIEKSKLDIISLIYQGVGEYSSLYEEKNIEFKVNSNVEEVFLDLDGKLISRVFENIIVNALKYSLPNTRVYVDVIDKENIVEIVFKNIANYEMNFNVEEMFERFVRADKSRNSSVEGSGLGLAISKSIVELHNGSIDIEVEGDMFKIFLLLPKI
ncbi:MAG: HAMP domain-containing histidine kinase [Clostridiales bacterium]|nr:HAMP domain-containing histidine kinase [Clostridiales bacterium]